VYVDGRVTRAYGLRAWFGVDAIGLDPIGEHLYFATLNGGEMWRLRAADVADVSLDDDALAARLEHVAQTTMTDGITIDEAGHVYLTDMEHSQIVRLHADGSLDVLVRDPILRWPDGFSWGADRALYVTASALHLYLGKLIVTDRAIAGDAPYHVLRIDAGKACGPTERCFATPGH
jgi:sugar lactone lactonase YvrE